MSVFLLFFCFAVVVVGQVDPAVVEFLFEKNLATGNFFGLISEEYALVDEPENTGYVVHEASSGAVVFTLPSWEVESIPRNLSHSQVRSREPISAAMWSMFSDSIQGFGSGFSIDIVIEPAYRNVSDAFLGDANIFSISRHKNEIALVIGQDRGNLLVYMRRAGDTALGGRRLLWGPLFDKGATERPQYWTITYDRSANLAALYLNGVLVDQLNKEVAWPGQTEMTESYHLRFGNEGLEKGPAPWMGVVHWARVRFEHSTAARVAKLYGELPNFVAFAEDFFPGRESFANVTLSKFVFVSSGVGWAIEQPIVGSEAIIYAELRPGVEHYIHAESNDPLLESVFWTMHVIDSSGGEQELDSVFGVVPRENRAPWNLFGNKPWPNPREGLFVLTCTPYSADGTNGQPGTPLKARFILVNATATPPTPLPSPFSLPPSVLISSPVPAIGSTALTQQPATTAIGDTGALPPSFGTRPVSSSPSPSSADLGAVVGGSLAGLCVIALFLVAVLLWCARGSRSIAASKDTPLSTVAPSGGHRVRSDSTTRSSSSGGDSGGHDSSTAGASYSRGHSRSRSRSRSNSRNPSRAMSRTHSRQLLNRSTHQSHQRASTTSQYDQVPVQQYTSPPPPPSDTALARAPQHYGLLETRTVNSAYIDASAPLDYAGDYSSVQISAKTYDHF